jgi:peptide/nickel transport system substrate-binding protein
MRRKHVLSVLMLSMGVALLVAAMTVGVASARTHQAHYAKSQRGGVLRIDQSGGGFDTLDPQLAYVTNDWTVLSNTQILLVNFPDKAGKAGTELFPEAAKSFPTISKDGKTVTFQIRSGLKFNNGKPVTAASFQRAFERVLSPQMYAQYGCFDYIDQFVVGGTAFADCADGGKNATANHISGISAKGQTLTVHLTKPNATFVNIMAMQWFGAIMPNMPYTSSDSGILTYPSAGPYYLATNQPDNLTVLKRNKYWLGEHMQRPANPDTIVIHTYPDSDGEAAVLQTQAGEIDMDMAGVPADQTAKLAQQYGVNKSVYHIGGTSCIIWSALNNGKAPTDNASVRQAINYAISRNPIIALAGPGSGQSADQILVPGLPGYQKINIYPSFPNFAKARQVGGSALTAAANDQVNIYYRTSSHLQTNIALYEKKQLQTIGFKNVVLQAADLTSYYGPLETKATAESAAGYNLARSGWCADYFDPFDYINVNFDGRTISDTGNVDYFYFNNASFNKQMDHAASLSGTARATAYAALDKELMQKYAPAVPFEVLNDRFLTSKRVKNWIYSYYFGEPDFNAMVIG